MIVQIPHTDTSSDTLSINGILMWAFKGGTAAPQVALQLEPEIEVLYRTMPRDAALYRTTPRNESAYRTNPRNENLEAL